MAKNTLNRGEKSCCYLGFHPLKYLFYALSRAIQPSQEIFKFVVSNIMRIVQRGIFCKLKQLWYCHCLGLGGNLFHILSYSTSRIIFLERFNSSIVSKSLILHSLFFPRYLLMNKMGLSSQVSYVFVTLLPIDFYFFLLEKVVLIVLILVDILRELRTLL